MQAFSEKVFPLTNPFCIWEMGEIIRHASMEVCSHLFIQFKEILNNCISDDPQERFRSQRLLFYYVGLIVRIHSRFRF